MEKIKFMIIAFFMNIVNIITKAIYVALFLIGLYFGAKMLGVNVSIPSFSWWSATFLSDNYSKSIITEVEASGHNIRNIQYVDAFGRVCTNSYANAGTGLDCDYPQSDKKDWTIEDYKKALRK